MNIRNICVAAAGVVAGLALSASCSGAEEDGFDQPESSVQTRRQALAANLFGPNGNFEGVKYSGYTSEYDAPWANPRSHQLGMYPDAGGLPIQYAQAGSQYLMAHGPTGTGYCNGRPCRVWCKTVNDLVPGHYYDITAHLAALSSGADNQSIALQHMTATDADAGTLLATQTVHYDAGDAYDWYTLTATYVPPVGVTQRKFCLVPPTGGKQWWGVDNVSMYSRCGNDICEPQYGEDGANCPGDCICGNGLCESSYNENELTCPQDCTACTGSGSGCQVPNSICCQPIPGRGGTCYADCCPGSNAC